MIRLESLDSEQLCLVNIFLTDLFYQNDGRSDTWAPADLSDSLIKVA